MDGAAYRHVEQAAFQVDQLTSRIGVVARGCEASGHFVRKHFAKVSGPDISPTERLLTSKVNSGPLQNCEGGPDTVPLSAFTIGFGRRESFPMSEDPYPPRRVGIAFTRRVNIPHRAAKRRHRRCREWPAYGFPAEGICRVHPLLSAILSFHRDPVSMSVETWRQVF